MRRLPSIGGSTENWRTKGSMDLAPVLVRMLQICKRTVARLTPCRRATSRACSPSHSPASTRVSAGVKRVAAGEGLHRQRLAGLAPAQDQQRGLTIDAVQRDHGQTHRPLGTVRAQQLAAAAPRAGQRVLQQALVPGLPHQQLALPQLQRVPGIAFGADGVVGVKHPRCASTSTMPWLTSSSIKASQKVTGRRVP